MTPRKIHRGFSLIELMLVIALMIILIVLFLIGFKYVGRASQRNSTLAITEWGLFSALTVGTLWDHRVFSAINGTNVACFYFKIELEVFYLEQIFSQIRISFRTILMI